MFFIYASNFTLSGGHTLSVLLRLWLSEVKDSFFFWVFFASSWVMAGLDLFIWAHLHFPVPLAFQLWSSSKVMDTHLIFFSPCVLLTVSLCLCLFLSSPLPFRTFYSSPTCQIGIHCSDLKRASPGPGITVVQRFQGQNPTTNSSWIWRFFPISK